MHIHQVNLHIAEECKAQEDHEWLESAYSTTPMFPESQYHQMNSTNQSHADMFLSDPNPHSALFPQWDVPLIPIDIEPLSDINTRRQAIHEQVEELLRIADYHDQYGYDDEEDDLASTNIYHEMQAYGEIDFHFLFA